MSLFAGTWHSLIHQKYISLFFICHNLISLLPIKAVPLSSLSVVSFSLLTDLCDSYWRALVVYQTYIPCYFICWFKVCQLCMSLSFLSYMSSSSSVMSLFVHCYSVPFRFLYIGYFSVGEPFFLTFYFIIVMFR